MAVISMESERFYRRIAEVSLKKYRELPKKGKPVKEQEWTPLATVVRAEGMDGYITGRLVETLLW